MQRKTTTCTTAAIVSTVAALSGLTTATATPVDEIASTGEQNMSIQATRGFDIFNRSSTTFTLVWVGGDLSGDDPSPARGSVLSPGSFLHFEVKAWGSRQPNVVEAWFDAAGSNPRVEDLVIGMAVYGFTRSVSIKSALVTYTRHDGEVILEDK